MKNETLTTNILSEEFEIPSCTTDLQMAIEFALVEYEEKPLFRKAKRDFKNKLNELIDSYNERRGMHIYPHVK